ncbi:MAG: hypothetical protein KGJ11_04000, partial [Candidatus Omnitrophica bacterium]|nr:hypothetical protein [Candidatus Omnitrophota bacterium]
TGADCKSAAHASEVRILPCPLLAPASLDQWGSWGFHLGFSKPLKAFYSFALAVFFWYKKGHCKSYENRNLEPMRE